MFGPTNQKRFQLEYHRSKLSVVVMAQSGGTAFFAPGAGLRGLPFASVEPQSSSRRIKVT